MKRNLILCALFFVLPFFVAAQQWALPSSVWRMAEFHAFFDPTYYSISLQKDTIVDGKSCAKTSSYQYPFTYLQNDTVFIYISGQFRPTYRYNAVAGDTLSLHFWHSCFPMYNFADSTVRVIVDSVVAIPFQNQSLRRFYVHVEQKYDTLFTFYPKQFYYTEKMGSNIGFAPSFSCYFDEEATSLCDYGDSTFADFWAVGARCSPVGIAEVGENRFSVFPNPTQGSGTLFIQEQKSKQLQKVSIIDATGREVLCFDQSNLAAAEKTGLPIAALHAGSYMVCFKYAYHLFSFQKLIVTP